MLGLSLLQVFTQLYGLMLSGITYLGSSIILKLPRNQLPFTIHQQNLNRPTTTNFTNMIKETHHGTQMRRWNLSNTGSILSRIDKKSPWKTQVHMQYGKLPLMHSLCAIGQIYKFSVLSLLNGRPNYYQAWWI